MGSTEHDDVPTFETLCETLVDASDATFVAATEQSLADQSPTVVFHTPAGTTGNKGIVETLIDQLGRFETIEFEGRNLPGDLQHVRNTDVHTFRRVPIYVQGHPGIEDISIDDGLADARRFLEGEATPTPAPSDTIPLEDLVREIAETGAVAVELTNDFFIESGTVDLRIPTTTPPAGHEVAGPYTSVTVDGKEYDLTYRFVRDGPGGYSTIRTPLYFTGKGDGTDVPVADGMQRFRELARLVEEKDGRREVLRALEDRIVA